MVIDHEKMGGSQALFLGKITQGEWRRERLSATKSHGQRDKKQDTEDHGKGALEARHRVAPDLPTPTNQQWKFGAAAVSQ